MPAIRPFRGLRYAPTLDLDTVVAPPYDVIDADMRAALAAIPHNAVHLILDTADTTYEQAGARLARWRDDGFLVSEPQPVFYIYAQTFRFLGGNPHTRAGIIGAVHHGPSIWGHERTHQGPKDDRFRLLSACKTNLSPIFGLVDDEQGAVDALVGECMAAGAAVRDFTDADDVRHQLWVETDPDRGARISAAMRDTHIVIADGHHRYETSVTYADTVGGPGSDAVMMMCVSMRSPGLRIYPYHRVLAHRPAANGAEPAGWSAETLPGAPDWAAVKARLAAVHADAHAFGIYTPQQCVLLSKPRDPHAGVAADLDAAVLQSDIFESAWGINVEALNHDGGLSYTPDGVEAMRRVDAGVAEVAVLVNPTPTDDVVACARAGHRMPQKSTYFYPKLLTGLVFRPLADDPAPA